MQLTSQGVIQQDQKSLFGLLMVEKISLKWVCPACKVSPQNASHQGASAAEITSIVGNALTMLQLSINQYIAQSAESLRSELTTIREKVNVVESSLASKCSADDTRRIAQCEVSSLQFNFKQSLESDVCHIVRAEKDRENRKNNVIAYGIQPSQDDSRAILSILDNDFGIKCDSVTNVQRLLPCTREGSMVQQSGSRPPPVISTVSSFALKKQILQKSFEKKGEIQFRNNMSREDHARHKTLVEELKARTAAGEINLAIRDFQIVSKTDQAKGKYPHPSRRPCSTKST